MPDAPKTATITLRTDPSQWELAQGTVTQSPPVAPSEPARGIFKAAEVHVGSVSLRVEGPGATLEHRESAVAAGAFVVGRVYSLAFPYLAFETGGDADADDMIEVEVATACGFLGLLRNYGWRATDGDAGFRALFGSDEVFTAAAVGGLAVVVPPEPEQPAEPATVAAPAGDGETPEAIDPGSGDPKEAA